MIYTDLNTDSPDNVCNDQQLEYPVNHANSFALDVDYFGSVVLKENRHRFPKVRHTPAHVS